MTKIFWWNIPVPSRLAAAFFPEVSDLLHLPDAASWEDIPEADDLCQLMQINFPALAALNTGDMKWKKFIYKQLCSREGIYVCPAPSCSVCADFAHCFAPED